jgi:uncharacterized Fe-S cluster-containing radical SAM superfamily protein
LIDTDAFSASLRMRGIDLGTKQVRVTDFRGSKQETDLAQPVNCGGLGRIRHFKLSTSAGWPPNPLPATPVARALGISPSAGIDAQVFQNAVCNWRCWYCFVDFPLLSGNPKYSELVTAPELINRYLATEPRAPVIDLSGGQPDLVPEWVAWMIAEIRARGLETFVWSDDNLSNDYYFSKLTARDRTVIEDDHRYGKVCCFKGFDEASFAFNTKAAPELFDRQFELMSRLVIETPLDLYAYATFTSPSTEAVAEKMQRFVDRLQLIDVALPLRTVPLEISVFSPVQGRMGPDHVRALEIQHEAIAAWNHELASRFGQHERDRSISDVQLRR